MIMKAAVMLFIFILDLNHVTSEDSWKIYHLQPDGVADNMTYLLIPRLQDAMKLDTIENEVVETRTFSLCVWFNIDAFTKNPTVLSYGISDHRNNEMSIAFHKGIIYPHVFGYFPGAYFLPTIHWWHHLCFIWHHHDILNSENQLVLYIDGNLRNKVRGPDDPMYLNGTLVVGQEQDSLGGDFNRKSVFLGHITQLNMWNHALTTEEVQQLSTCSMISREPELKWGSIRWVTNGSFREENGNPCHQNNLLHKILIPSRLNFVDAKRFCETIDMKLQVPKSPEDDHNSKLIIQNAPSVCLSEFSEKPTAFVGVKYDAANGYWKDVHSDEQVQYLGFVAKQSYDWDHAMMMSNGYWQQINEYIQSCPLCEVHLPQTRLYLRGLCRNEKAQPKDYMTFYPRSNNDNVLSLVGGNGMNIFQEKKKWVLYDEMFNVAISEKVGSLFPLGIHNWTIKDTSSICKTPLISHTFARKRHKLIELSLTTCGPNKFPCSDGTCIDMSLRCSFHPECSDIVDEEDCNLLQIPHRYIEAMEPPQMPLAISISIDITKIIAMQISEQIIQVNFEVWLEWTDTRLRYRNLRPSFHQNRINEDDLKRIWRPNVQVFNEQRLLFSVDPTHFVSVKRRGNSTRIDNDLIYQGSENPIFYNLFYSKNLDCTMNLALFPFDSQYCDVILKLDNVDPDNVDFTSIGNHTSEDIKVLVDFTITHETMAIKGNLVRLTFHLLNQPIYHVFALYMPTCLLHIIGYGTFLISADNFQDRGAISLTTLLVLISLYSDVLATLPQTSYLKCIDIWFIYSISFLSSIIAVHLITNDTSDRLALKRKVNNQTILNWARNVLGGICIIFQFSYWAYIYVNTT